MVDGEAVSMATRRELLAAIRQRYGAATREEKGRILDELVAVAGYHRKHAIRVLGRRERSWPSSGRNRAGGTTKAIARR